MVPQEEPGPQERGRAMDREVSEFEKIKALTWKDLTIRITRRPVMYGIMSILLILFVWMIPIIYFAKDHWKWEVKKEGAPTIDPIFGNVLIGAMNKYGSNRISVESANLDSQAKKFQSCLKQNKWWMNLKPLSGMTIELTNDQSTEHVTITADSISSVPQNSGDMHFGPINWSLDANGNLQNNEKQTTFYNAFLLGLPDGRQVDQVVVDAMFAQIISTCVHDSKFFYISDLNPLKFTYKLNGNDEEFCVNNEEDVGAAYEELIKKEDQISDFIEVQKTFVKELTKHSKLVVHKAMTWNKEAFGAYMASGLWTFVPGIVFLFALFFAITGYFIHIVEERNTGIKTIMLSMGLSNESYMAASYLAYLIEASPVIILSSLLMCAMVAHVAGTASGVYVWFAWVMTFVNMGPFLIFFSCFLHTAKNAGALMTGMKFMIPLFPTMIICYTLNDESAVIRFFSCLLPPMNFIFALRDSILGSYSCETVIAIFFNFVFWWMLAYYFDSTMPTSSSVASKKHCFCFRRSFWESKKEFDRLDGVQLTTVGDIDEDGAPALLVIKDLVKNFGSFRAVDGMNLEIEENTIYGLLGFNGAGKTTTINMITGILSPTSGQIYVDGVDISTQMNRVRAHMGMCPQHNVLFDSLTVEEHMYLFGRLRGMSNEEVDLQMHDLLLSMNLQHQRETLAKNLSGGQKRMLCMIQAFLGNPKLILLDEPTSGVDAESRRAMWNFIMANKSGKVIILTTHQMGEADVLCDKIGIMSAGQLLVEDTPLNLKNQYAVGFTFICANANPEEIQDVATNYFKNYKIIEEADEVHVQIPSEYVDRIPKFIKDLESLPSVANINVHAATLETVFLELAKNVAQKEKSSEDKDVESDSPQEQMENLEELAADANNFSRPNVFLQFLYLLVKRIWLSIIYWESILVGFIYAIILAVVLIFVFFLMGLNSSETFDMNKQNFTYYAPDKSNYSNWDPLWSKHGSGKFVHNEKEWKETTENRRASLQDPIFSINAEKKEIYWDQFHFGGSIAVSTYIGSEGKQTSFKYTGRVQSMGNDVLAIVILIIGVGLIICNTWHIVGKELREGLYEYQIQNGIHPALIWISNWIFDVCLNTAVLSIFLAIAIPGSEKGTLRLYAIWGGFVAFLPYVILQYILVWSTKNDKLITNLLGWSSVVGFGLFILEFQILTSAAKGDPDLLKKMMYLMFGPEYEAWKLGADCKILLIFHYFIPPLQFMFAMLQGFILSVKPDPDPVEITAYYNRVWFSLISASVWALIFTTIQLMYAYKKDPEADREVRPTPPDVWQEKLRCRQMLERYEQGEVQNGNDIESDNVGFPMILADSLKKVFWKLGGRFIAVNDLSFHVNEGECFGLLGKNGAGKSTTMNMLTTSMQPSSGVSILDQSSGMGHQRKILGYCPQANLLWEKLTVYQHLTYFALMKGVPISRIDNDIKILCSALTLDPYYHRATGKLSGGNKRKLQLATSLIGSVKVIFLDEPSTGVDPFARKSMLDVIQRYRKDRAIILTTHMMEEVDGLCNRVGIMVNGDFRCINTINQLINSTNSGYQMEVSLTHLASGDNAQNLHDFIIEALPGSMLTENDSLVMTYQIPAENNELSHIFEIGNEIKTKFGTEYVISQMTMDQLFLHLTHDQIADDMAYRQDEVRDMCCFGLCCCPTGSNRS
jgi:ABC-type multidrug transport system ATPase subunit